MPHDKQLKDLQNSESDARLALTQIRENAYALGYAFGYNQLEEKVARLDSDRQTALARVSTLDKRVVALDRDKSGLQQSVRNLQDECVHLKRELEKVGPRHVAFPLTGGLVSSYQDGPTGNSDSAKLERMKHSRNQATERADRAVLRAEKAEKAVLDERKLRFDAEKAVESKDQEIKKLEQRIKNQYDTIQDLRKQTETVPFALQSGHIDPWWERTVTFPKGLVYGYNTIAFEPKKNTPIAPDPKRTVDALRQQLEASTHKELGDLRQRNFKLYTELNEAKQRIEKLSRLATQLESAQQTVVTEREELIKRIAAAEQARDKATRRAQEAESARNVLPDVITCEEDGEVHFNTAPVRFNGDDYQVQSIEIDRERDVSSITYVRAEEQDE